MTIDGQTDLWSGASFNAEIPLRICLVLGNKKAKNVFLHAFDKIKGTVLLNDGGDCVKF